MEELAITFYTDPICCWSWALERRLMEAFESFPGKVRLRYVMYAMITDWNDYYDPINSVSRPVQMGPVWMHASTISGVPMNDRIWYLDPPSSSVPSALAVKSACLQSEQAGALFLQAVREAVMTNGMNISRVSVLHDIAAEVEAKNPGMFSATRFQQDLKGQSPLIALKRDMDEATSNRIARFPTLVMKSAHRRAILVTGYRPQHVLLDAMQAAVSEEKTSPNEVPAI